MKDLKKNRSYIGQSDYTEGRTELPAIDICHIKHSKYNGMLQARHFEQLDINPCRHSHPSGKSAESRRTWKKTKGLVEAGKIICIDVLVHIVLGDGEYVSMKKKGYFRAVSFLH
ncbi:JAB domain-containing protein [Virgibacillus halodenitrificans]|uniref:JAB domain-containing protein n=1 Tax=Virgibacillus halodenitrificans TaxID=1482 RepID=UPI000761C50D|nr:hypothetical protein [Virgibacillus halodenitrificans]